MLNIKGPSKKPCDLCRAEESVDARFTDGFHVSACWRCLQKLWKARTNGKEHHAEAQASGSAAQL